MLYTDKFKNAIKRKINCAVYISDRIKHAYTRCPSDTTYISRCLNEKLPLVRCREGITITEDI